VSKYHKQKTSNIVFEEPRLLQSHLPYSGDSPQLQLVPQAPIGFVSTNERPDANEERTNGSPRTTAVAFHIDYCFVKGVCY